MNKANQVARLKRFMDQTAEALHRARNTHPGSAEMVVLVPGPDELTLVLQEDGTLSENIGKVMGVDGDFPASEVTNTRQAEVKHVKEAMEAIENSLEARHRAARRAYNRALQEYRDQQS